VGAVARAMANFGFLRLILVNPKCTLDDEAKKRAKHANFILDKSSKLKSFEEVKKKFDVVIGTSGVSCSDYNVPRSPVLCRNFPQKLKGVSGKIALVFGSENGGLSVEQIKKCDFLVTIPTDKKYEIMNLSHAVSILLYELSRDAYSEELEKDHILASTREKSELLKVVDSLIEQEHFRTDNERITQELVWRRFVGKAMLTRREAFSIIGFLKKLKKK
jgi:TrmH family RNA methyltransferase